MPEDKAPTDYMIFTVGTYEDILAHGSITSDAVHYYFGEEFFGESFEDFLRDLYHDAYNGESTFKEYTVVTWI